MSFKLKMPDCMNPCSVPTFDLDADTDVEKFTELANDDLVTFVRRSSDYPETLSIFLHVKSGNHIAIHNHWVELIRG